MSLLRDIARAAKAGRRAVRQVQATVQAVERGAADVQALARACEGAAEQFKAAGTHVRSALAGVEGALGRVSAPVAAKVTVRSPQDAEVIDAEVIDFGPAPRGKP